MRRLLLFDVDGTLIRRGDPDHLDAVDHGVHSVFPDAASATVRNVEFDGKVDRVIAAEVLAQADITINPADTRLDGVFDLAGAYYRAQWADRQSGGTDDLLPGVAELIPALDARSSDVALGVVTGGSRGIVEVKLERLDLSGYFPFGAFGNEVNDRPALIRLAIERANTTLGELFNASQALVIGDTPHDVTCAHANQIPCLAVATGKFSVAELHDAGADMVVKDLSNVEQMIDVLLGETRLGAQHD
jgi:phosphoglycolate phosphatase